MDLARHQLEPHAAQRPHAGKVLLTPSMQMMERHDLVLQRCSGKVGHPNRSEGVCRFGFPARGP